MADPVTWAIVLSATAAGTAAYGEHQAGKAAEAEGKAKRDLHNYNAVIAEKNAAAAADAARADELKARKQAEDIKSRRRAVYGKSGMSTAGTPLAVMGEEAAELELDILTERRNRQLEITGYKQQAAVETASGQMAEIRGANRKRAYKARAGSTLLSGASGVAGMKYKYGKTG